MNRLLIVLLAACTMLVAGLPVSAADTPPPRDSIYQLPVQLTDQAGGTYGWKTLRGKPRLVAMVVKARRCSGLRS